MKVSMTTQFSNLQSHFHSEVNIQSSVYFIDKIFPTGCQCRLDVTDVGLIPGSGRSPGGGHGNPFQYSCLENPIDRGAWC